MTEEQWMVTEDLEGMMVFLLEELSWEYRPSHRKMRLFACAAARYSAKNLDVVPLGVEAVTVARKYADFGNDGTVNPFFARLQEIHHSVAVHSWLWAATRLISNRRATLRAARYAIHEQKQLHHATKQQAWLLRSIIGNPFHVCPQPPTSPLIASLAESAYTEKGKSHRGCLLKDSLAVLADALEDEGYDFQPLLRHLRSEEYCTWCMPTGSDFGGGGSYWCPGCGGTSERGKGGEGWMPMRGPHVHGDWALDLVRRVNKTPPCG